MTHIFSLLTPFSQTAVFKDGQITPNIMTHPGRWLEIWKGLSGFCHLNVAANGYCKNLVIISRGRVSFWKILQTFLNFFSGSLYNSFSWIIIINHLGANGEKWKKNWSDPSQGKKKISNSMVLLKNNSNSIHDCPKCLPKLTKFFYHNVDFKAWILDFLPEMKKWLPFYMF